MERKRQFVLGGVVLLVFLLLLLLLLLFGKPKREVQTITNTVPNADLVLIPPTADATGGVNLAPEVAFDVRNVRRFAMQFAERFGSFSSEASYQNLRDLQPVLTPRMQEYVQSIIAGSGVGGEFYGVTTRALSAAIEEKTDTAATVLVGAQREEVKAGTPRVFTQSLRVTFEKSGDGWKVDSAEWIPESVK